MVKIFCSNLIFTFLKKLLSYSDFKDELMILSSISSFILIKENDLIVSLEIL